VFPEGIKSFIVGYVNKAGYPERHTLYFALSATEARTPSIVQLWRGGTESVFMWLASPELAKPEKCYRKTLTFATLEYCLLDERRF
jgi:hypothetical protein